MCWGPPLTQQRLQIAEPCYIFGSVLALKNYNQLRWLPVSELIQYQSLRQMYRQFHFQQSHSIPLNPAIQFGHEPHIVQDHLCLYSLVQSIFV